ncbi:hypothetical protein QJS10_CPB15g00808 [Acorus calamus]|uniref:Uncharacterized protein n=1 Tax=Acorus calamus TaxID=4465 RepID=A0AAV9D3I4_ACOCL|nr:hypothetical protein QJS10_CPB15g00808 [Acorus calamus]
MALPIRLFLLHPLPSPLLPLIRDSISIVDSHLSVSVVASFSEVIPARLLICPACDLLGPRAATVVVSLSTAPFVFALFTIESPEAFIVFDSSSDCRGVRVQPALDELSVFAERRWVRERHVGVWANNEGDERSGNEFSNKPYKEL